MSHSFNVTDLRTTALTGLVLIVLYIALYRLNLLIMGNEEFGGLASILFLPAFIRLLATLLIGWWSIPALFIAAWFCVDLGLSPASHFIVVAALAIGAPLTIQCARQAARLNTSLANLTGKRLLILSFASALGSAAAYHLGLLLTGTSHQLDETFLATIIGDSSGTWLVIYALKGAMTLLGRRLQPRL